MARKVRIGRVEDFPAGAITEVEVEGEKVIVVQDAEGLCAAHNKCPHLGLSLTSGTRRAQATPTGSSSARGTTPGSWSAAARTSTGRPGIAGRSVPAWSRKLISAGRKPAPLTTYTVIVEDDEVFIEM